MGHKAIDDSLMIDVGKAGGEEELDSCEGALISGMGENEGVIKVEEDSFSASPLLRHGSSELRDRKQECQR
jgi:hypothetical protein